MRINIEIDDELLSQAMAASGQATKRATVEAGLRLLVRIRRQAEALRALKGLGWESVLDDVAARPTADELRARLSRRSSVNPSSSPAQALRAERDGR